MLLQAMHDLFTLVLEESLEVVPVIMDFMFAYSLFSLWSIMGVYMLMFSLHTLAFRLTQVIQNTSLKQHLEGRIVWFLTCYWYFSHYKYVLKKVAYETSSFLLVSTVVMYLPKSQADKKKSLLGSSPDFSEAQVTSKVCYLLPYFYN